MSKRGCFLFPVGWAALTLALSAIGVGIAGGSADAFLGTWLVLLFGGWIIMLIVMASRGANRLGRYARGAVRSAAQHDEPTSAGEVATEKAFLKRHSERARNRASSRGPAPEASLPAKGDEGDEAWFTYIDADGVVTDRQLVNWKRDGEYVEGFCLDRREHRTFRVERIEDWQAR